MGNVWEGGEMELSCICVWEPGESVIIDVLVDQWLWLGLVGRDIDD